MSENGKLSDLQPTSGAAWRKPYEEGEIVELPSGKVARLSRVNVETLIVILGDLPNELTQIIADMILGKEEISLEIDSLKDLTGFIDLTSAICQASFLEPKIVENPQKDDEIAAGYIDLDDKTFVFEREWSRLLKLEPFREEQKSDVVAMDGRKGDPDTSK